MRTQASDYMYLRATRLGSAVAAKYDVGDRRARLVSVGLVVQTATGMRLTPRGVSAALSHAERTALLAWTRPVLPMPISHQKEPSSSRSAVSKTTARSLERMGIATRVAASMVLSDEGRAVWAIVHRDAE